MSVDQEARTYVVTIQVLDPDDTPPTAEELRDALVRDAGFDDDYHVVTVSEGKS